MGAFKHYFDVDGELDEYAIAWIEAHPAGLPPSQSSHASSSTPPSPSSSSSTHARDNEHGSESEDNDDYELSEDEEVAEEMSRIDEPLSHIKAIRYNKRLFDGWTVGVNSIVDLYQEAISLLTKFEPSNRALPAVWVDLAEYHFEYMEWGPCERACREALYESDHSGWFMPPVTRCHLHNIITYSDYRDGEDDEVPYRYISAAHQSAQDGYEVAKKFLPDDVSHMTAKERKEWASATAMYALTSWELNDDGDRDRAVRLKEEALRHVPEWTIVALNFDDNRHWREVGADGVNADGGSDADMDENDDSDMTGNKGGEGHAEEL